MKEELIDVLRDFIELCDILRSNGKIDAKFYEELTKEKLEFIKTVKKVG